ncbi:MAG: ATP-binding protein [Acidobacteria bacterium]|nr:ATP-binding protein [Acidobacteriota bacterium]
MGETRVDLLHLLEDLRDAYVGSLEETILTEIIANALDSGASLISLQSDPTAPSLTVLDNGSGMRRRELRRYHDLAASTKSRGAGIGFAGVGIKLGLLVSSDVVTETRSGSSHVATAWRLASRNKAPWKWIPPAGRLAAQGTAVTLIVRNPLSPLVDPGFIEATVRQNFHTLIDPLFDDLLSRHYPKGVRFAIDGHAVDRGHVMAGAEARLEIRLARRRKPSAIGYLQRADGTLGEHERGVAISTYGKVIKRGWDWLGLSPALAETVSGVLEAPDLAACLSLNKADFIRVGPRGATYLAYRKAIQEAVTAQLAAWGDVPAAGEARPKTFKLQRDLERVLADLADDFPLLRSLVEARRGGQKRLPLGAGAGELPQLADVVATTGEATAPAPEEEPRPAPSEVEPPPQPVGSGEVRLGEHGRRKPARLGLTLAFEKRPDDLELARLIESTVWVNEAHPAYARAVASRSLGYHICLAVALALAPLTTQPAGEHAFITSFLARWGAALDGARSRRRRTSRKT